ncbi:MAG TPA: group 1 truncated hemoglobin [Caulobacteraceae bacterium]|nr:group 1 truncated hemoglobin [Caulobacteraceae bacterium]
MKAAFAALALLALTCGAARAAEDIPPYTPSDANAGTTPLPNDTVYKAFHEKAGIDRVVSTLVRLYHQDPRLKDIFAAADDARLSQMLAEQVCYVLGGPCRYSGRDMAAAHKDMGVEQADFNALVEDLQAAMDQEKVPFWAQNKLLAKLAPMQRVIVATKNYPG